MKQSGEAEPFAPDETIPILELEQGDRTKDCGFYCLHFEVDSVDSVLQRLSWLEPVGPGREERPTGRDLVNARWAGWAFHLGVFAAHGPYWRVPSGRRCTVVGSVPSLNAATEVLRANGWKIIHRWAHGQEKGVYIGPPGQLRVRVSVQDRGRVPESISVRITEHQNAASRPERTVPGLFLEDRRNSKPGLADLAV